MVLLEIHQRFKGHFLNELRVSFKKLKSLLEAEGYLESKRVSAMGLLCEYTYRLTIFAKKASL